MKHIDKETLMNELDHHIYYVRAAASNAYWSHSIDSDRANIILSAVSQIETVIHEMELEQLYDKF